MEAQCDFVHVAEGSQTLKSSQTLEILIDLHLHDFEVVLFSLLLRIEHMQVRGRLCLENVLLDDANSFVQLQSSVVHIVSHLQRVFTLQAVVEKPVQLSVEFYAAIVVRNRLTLIVLAVKSWQDRTFVGV